MEENEELTELLNILKDVYGWNDTNELTQIQKELVNDVISSVKILNKNSVINCPICGSPECKEGLGYHKLDK